MVAYFVEEEPPYNLTFSNFSIKMLCHLNDLNCLKMTYDILPKYAIIY